MPPLRRGKEPVREGLRGTLTTNLFFQGRRDLPGSRRPRAWPAARRTFLRIYGLRGERWHVDTACRKGADLNPVTGKYHEIRRHSSKYGTGGPIRGLWGSGREKSVAGSSLPAPPKNRRQHHPLARLPTGYRHALPPPPGAGEEAEGRAEWGLPKKHTGTHLRGGDEPPPRSPPPVAISTTVQCTGTSLENRALALSSPGKPLPELFLRRGRGRSAKRGRGGGCR